MKSETKNSFLAVSYSVPQLASGTPVTVRRFLKNFTSNEVVLIGRPVKKNDRLEVEKLLFKVISLPTLPVGVRGERFWRIISVIPGIILGLYAIYRYKLKSILAFYRDEGSLLTGYLLHRLTNLPFFPYFFDLYQENYPNGFQGEMAKWLQPRVFNSAKKVIVLSEGIRKYYEEQYRISSFVLPHCSDNFSKKKPTKRKIKEEVIKIGYLGGVNFTRLYSLKLLTDAINNNNQYLIHYFTPTSKEYLKENDLLRSNVIVSYMPDDSQLINDLTMCDILFLPSSRDTGTHFFEQQMLTGFPTKILDYFLCRRPILVHGQPDFFVTGFFEKYRCGHIVNGGSNKIFEGLERLKLDQAYCEELIINANRALEYFDGVRISNDFRDILSL